MEKIVIIVHKYVNNGNVRKVYYADFLEMKHVVVSTVKCEWSLCSNTALQCCNNENWPFILEGVLCYYFTVDETLFRQ